MACDDATSGTGDSTAAKRDTDGRVPNVMYDDAWNGRLDRSPTQAGGTCSQPVRMRRLDLGLQCRRFVPRLARGIGHPKGA